MSTKSRTSYPCFYMRLSARLTAFLKWFTLRMSAHRTKGSMSLLSYFTAHQRKPENGIIRTRMERRSLAPCLQLRTTRLKTVCSAVCTRLEAAESRRGTVFRLDRGLYSTRELG